MKGGEIMGKEKTYNRYFLLSMIVSSVMGSVMQWLQESTDPDSEGGKKITATEILDGLPIILDGARQAIEAKIIT